jgi:xanthine/CO dehydrogenase XdhC/CoxF family maturation factor
VIESGRPETLEFGIADETAWSVGLACGGRVRIFVERLEALGEPVGDRGGAR